MPVIPTMIFNLVAISVHAFERLRRGLRSDAVDEERGMGVVRAQDRKNCVGVGGVRPIVVGERDGMPRGAPVRDRRTEHLTLRQLGKLIEIVRPKAQEYHRRKCTQQAHERASFARAAATDARSPEGEKAAKSATIFSNRGSAVEVEVMCKRSTALFFESLIEYSRPPLTAQ